MCEGSLKITWLSENLDIEIWHFEGIQKEKKYNKQGIVHSKGDKCIFERRKMHKKGIVLGENQRSKIWKRGKRSFNDVN